MSRDLARYREAWERQGVAMDAAQMAALRGAAARQTRSRFGIGLGAVLVALGVGVALVEDAPGFGIGIAVTGLLVVAVMLAAGQAWGTVLRGGDGVRAVAGVAAASVVVAFVAMSWVVGAFVLGWSTALSVAVAVVAGACAVLLFLNLTLRRG